MDSRWRQLVDLLSVTRSLLARPENDFVWSSWEDAETALRELDALIARFESGPIPERRELDVLFAPTGPIQEVSLSSGWGDRFLTLANLFDAAIQDAYR